MDKNTIWSDYVQDGKLASFLAKHKIEDSIQNELLKNISTTDYKNDYKLVKQVLPLNVSQRLAGNIRAAAHQQKTDLVGIKIKSKTKALLDEAQKTTGASSTDETIFYLCDPAYHRDFLLDLSDNLKFSEIGHPSGKPYEWIMLETMEGYARRVFAHLYLTKHYPQITAAARNDDNMLSLTAARRKATKFGIKDVLKECFYLDFGAQNRKLFPSFQFDAAIAGQIQYLRAEKNGYSDHEWYFRLQGLEGSDGPSMIKLLSFPITSESFFKYLNKIKSYPFTP